VSESRPSLDQTYFETLYARLPDPWQFRTSAYERRKYGATLDILPRARYGRALEVGCSIGVFTRLLAERCDGLLALDTSSRALAEAERDNADLGHVEFRLATLPREFPGGQYDLIVLSEVLYYLCARDLAALADHCLGALSPGGHIVLCHWLGETNYPLGGDEAADLFVTRVTPRLHPSMSRRGPKYRLDLLTSRPQDDGEAARPCGARKVSPMASARRRA